MLPVSWHMPAQATCNRLLKNAHVVILRSPGDEESVVVSLRFFASLRMTGLLRIKKVPDTFFAPWSRLLGIRCAVDEP